MLAIKESEILVNHKLNVHKRKSKKTQILLYDTKRRINDFLNQIKFRKNGKFNDIPHFVISKNGTIYQLFDTNHSSVTFGNPKIDKKQIKIAIENLGWLQKNTITGFLSNWIGDSYRTEPYSKTWRGFFYYDKYSEQQIDSISELCAFLCEKHDIKYKCVPSQGFFQNASIFEGILCKSNFSSIYSDINPSFNFKKLIKNETSEDRI